MIFYNFRDEMEAALMAESDNKRKGVTRGSAMFARLLDNMLIAGCTTRDFFEMQREIKKEVNNNDQ